MHSCCSKVCTDESDLDDGGSEDDMVPDENFQEDAYRLPCQTVNTTSFLISFTAREYNVKNRIALIIENNCPMENTLGFSSQVLSLVPHFDN